jgi:hypothetical protein
MRRLRHEYAPARFAFLLVPMLLGTDRRPADAQWSMGAYMGAACTHPAAVSVGHADERPSMRIDAVTFRSESFRSPIYYGYRLGRGVGQRGFWIEAELIHLKVIANEVSLAPPLDALAMSHGMNFILVNVVWKRPLARRSRHEWVLRAGIGPTLPHTEVRIHGQAHEGYEAGGLGAQLSGGVALRLTRTLRLTGEYKFTFANPTLDVPGGDLHTSVRTHHVVWGVAAVF